MKECMCDVCGYDEDPGTKLYKGTGQTLCPICAFIGDWDEPLAELSRAVRYLMDYIRKGE